MANPTTDQQIRTRIDTFLAEISTLLKQSALESVRESLGDGGAHRRRGPGRPRKMTIRVGRRPRSMGKRGKRTSEQLAALAARVLAEVRSKQGRRGFSSSIYARPPLSRRGGASASAPGGPTRLPGRAVGRRVAAWAATDH